MTKQCENLFPKLAWNESSAIAHSALSPISRTLNPSSTFSRAVFALRFQINFRKKLVQFLVHFLPLGGRGTDSISPHRAANFLCQCHSPPMAIYCPLGHQHIPIGETELQREARTIRWQRDRLQADLDQKEAAIRETKNALNAVKSAKARLKNRIKNGVCPCCKRHFVNVERHMKSQHPEEFSE